MRHAQRCFGRCWPEREGARIVRGREGGAGRFAPGRLMDKWTMRPAAQRVQSVDNAGVAHRPHPSPT
jgi:hypothetical protein